LHDCLQESDKKRGGKNLSIKVMLVESEEFLGNLIRIKLRGLGLDVYLVRDGSKAQEMAPQFKPDVVVLSGSVPGCSGFDLCRLFAADALMKLVPIVFLAPQASSK